MSGLAMVQATERHSFPIRPGRFDAGPGPLHALGALQPYIERLQRPLRKPAAEA